jgi:hypothetical protein
MPGATMSKKAGLFLALMLPLMLMTAAQANPKRWKHEGWAQTDFSKTSVPFDEIVSGGPPKDGIPPIDRPRFKSASEVDDLAGVEPVVGLEIAGDAKAYPLRIMIWHEIVNDVVGGIPVAVTYCPLCNSSVVFDRRVAGRILDFGTTGKLRHSDLIMYDRQTESWWQQFTGEAIVGELLGAELKLVPTRLEAFKDFRTRHPKGRVLVPNNPQMRRYGTNPYVGYDTTSAPFLFKGEVPEGIEPMARVIVVRRKEADPVIVALGHLRRAGALTIDGVRLSWRAGRSSALDTREIARGRDIGTIEAVSDASATRGAPLVYDVTFAFVAHAFHPDVSIIGK